MLNRLFNVAVVLGVLYCLAQITVFAPRLERKEYLFVSVALVVARYLVRLPSGRAV